MKLFGDHMCQCTDRPCADRVQDEMNEWVRAESQHPMPVTAQRLTDEQTQRMAALTERYGKCMMRAMGAIP
jgi:hypothetical protein